MVCVISEKYALLVTLADHSQTAAAKEANFKTTQSEFQKSSQTATEQGKAKLQWRAIQTALLPVYDVK